MNPPAEKNHQRRHREDILTLLLRITPYFLVFLLWLMVGGIVLRGVPILAKEGTYLFTQQTGPVHSFYDEDRVYHQLSEKEFQEYRNTHPEGLYLAHQKTRSGGGLSGALEGTILLVQVALFFAFLIGFPTALFLSEYQEKGRLAPLVRSALNTLSGIPPIVFGLFGLVFFCFFFPVISRTEPLPRSVFHCVLPWLDGGGACYLSFQGWGLSLLAMGATLACMALPFVTAGCEKSLRQVPQNFRDAALSLGASRWLTIRQVVLRNALPGILATLLGGATRVAGAAAPILFTGAIAASALTLTDGHPGNPSRKATEFLGKESEALPYYIYTLSTEPAQTAVVRQMLDGAVFVLILVILVPAALSLLIQKKVTR